MFNESLQRALNSVDPNTDREAWLRFCEWAHAFHDIDTKELAKFGTFAMLEKNGEVKLPLKYLESIKDLWVKWTKAVETDSVSQV
jgi:hypothetical protein